MTRQIIVSSIVAGAFFLGVPSAWAADTPVATAPVTAADAGTWTVASNENQDSGWQ
jgi:hypothetical protein